MQIEAKYTTPASAFKKICIDFSRKDYFDPRPYINYFT